jgi:hypothetical protein
MTGLVIEPLTLKYSDSTDAPSTLAPGEAAYSAKSKTLFIGTTNGIAAIGGVALIATHVDEVDPHPQYNVTNWLMQLSQADQSLAQNIDDLASVLQGKADEADVSQFISDHLSPALDPHPQYLKRSEFQAWAPPSTLPFLVLTGNAQNPIALRITSTTNSGAFGAGALVCDGGISVARNANFNGDVFPLKALRHMGTQLGFYGAPTVSIPVVSASKNNPVALAQALLAALKSLGLITDQTTL